MCNRHGDCIWYELMTADPKAAQRFYGGLMDWSFYFRVPDIDRAVVYINDNDAQGINRPMEIPGSEHVLNGLDPQGAMFALIGKRKG